MCSNLSKIFTGIILKRFNSFLENRNILKEEQIGFKKNARTGDHMFILKTIIDMYSTCKFRDQAFWLNF